MSRAPNGTSPEPVPQNRLVDQQVRALFQSRLVENQETWTPPTMQQVQDLLRDQGLDGLVDHYRSYLDAHWVPRGRGGRRLNGAPNPTTRRTKATKMAWMFSCLDAHGAPPAEVVLWTKQQWTKALDALNSVAVADAQRGCLARKGDFRRLSQNTLSGGAVELNAFFRDYMGRPETRAPPLPKVLSRPTANHATWREIQRLRQAIPSNWPELKRRIVDFLLTYLWETGPRMSSITGEELAEAGNIRYRNFPLLGDIRPEDGVFVFRHVKNARSSRFHGERVYQGPADEGLFGPYVAYRAFLLSQGFSLDGPLFPWSWGKRHRQLTPDVLEGVLDELSRSAGVLYQDPVQPGKVWPVNTHDIRRGRGRELCLTVGPQYAAEVLMDTVTTIMNHYRGELLQETRVKLTEARQLRESHVEPARLQAGQFANANLDPSVSRHGF